MVTEADEVEEVLRPVNASQIDILKWSICKIMHLERTTMPQGKQRNAEMRCVLTSFRKKF